MFARLITQLYLTAGVSEGVVFGPALISGADKHRWVPTPLDQRYYPFSIPNVRTSCRIYCSQLVGWYLFLNFSNDELTIFLIILLRCTW